ncbi:MAG: adenylyl-sulfate kinase [Spirochaetaceae bacterium]|nr:adenylyl-sulfate kinase [Spirochaetaceae bacterium]
MSKVSPNVQWELGEVTLRLREKLNGHPALVVWLTGLSASGKSTLAKAAEQHLFEDGTAVARLDGDNVRHGLCGDLGFSHEDRNENIRRVAEVAAILYELGHVVICAFISPFAAERAFARSLVPEDRFLEVYLKCDLSECKRRDPKGLYKKAERGEIKGFTGVDAAYEEPEKPELVVDTGSLDEDSSAKLLTDTIMSYLSRQVAGSPASTESKPGNAGRWQ